MACCLQSKFESPLWSVACKCPQWWCLHQNNNVRWYIMMDTIGLCNCHGSINLKRSMLIWIWELTTGQTAETLLFAWCVFIPRCVLTRKEKLSHNLMIGTVPEIWWVGLCVCTSPHERHPALCLTLVASISEGFSRCNNITDVLSMKLSIAHDTSNSNLHQQYHQL